MFVSLLTATYWNGIVKNFIVWIQWISTYWRSDTSTTYENGGWTWNESSLVIRLYCCLDVPRVILYSLHKHKAMSATFEKQLKKKKLFLLMDEGCLPVRPSSCPHATARLLLDGFPWNFVSGAFTTIFQYVLGWRKSGRNNNLYENLRTCKISRRGFHNWDSHELRQKKQLTIWT